MLAFGCDENQNGSRDKTLSQPIPAKEQPGMSVELLRNTTAQEADIVKIVKIAKTYFAGHYKGPVAVWPEPVGVYEMADCWLVEFLKKEPGEVKPRGISVKILKVDLSCSFPPQA
jgi:hypothetical protein